MPTVVSNCFDCGYLNWIPLDHIVNTSYKKDIDIQNSNDNYSDTNSTTSSSSSASKSSSDSGISKKYKNN